MSKPWIHSQQNQRQWGGIPEDYIEINSYFDLTKSIIADNRHRAISHNSWFLSNVIERIFGLTKCEHCGKTGKVNIVEPNIINSNGRHVSVRDIGEQHILSDFANKFIPSGSDWLSEIPMRTWMENGKKDVPPSFKAVDEHTGKIKTTRTVMSFDND